MPSTNKQITDQLARLSLVFEAPMPKTIGSEPNPRYAQLVAVYVECLQPFHPWELEAGVKLALESHKYAKWPKPAELRDYCLEVQRAHKPPRTNGTPGYLLGKPHREPISPADRIRIGYQFQVLREYETSGCWGTLADCKAEALRRMANTRERVA